MQLQLKIVEDWKAAVKSRSEERHILSLIITELKNRAIKENIGSDSARVVNNEMALEVLQKMAKQRRESIESFKVADRVDLIDKESLELSVIERYLPSPLTDEELRSKVMEIVENVSAESMADIGKIMGPAMKAVQGRADGKRIKIIAQSILANR